MDTALIILFFVIWLIVWFFLSVLFYNVAQEKGYDSPKYMWITFLFGIFGCLLVVALPDRKGQTIINIPNNVTNIGNNAFERRSDLKSVTIPDSVTSIGAYAFYDCNSLKSVTIPDSVTNIGAGAFSGCSNLTTVAYCGSEADWNEMNIGSNNAYLKNANIVFNYVRE